MANDEERRFRLRPRKPVARTKRIALAGPLIALIWHSKSLERDPMLPADHTGISGGIGGYIWAYNSPRNRA
jgi:hypothetical protein